MQETFCKTKITSLVCGTGLTAVQGGDGLCQSCTTLTNVVFQSGCSLGQNEFYGCTALAKGIVKLGKLLWQAIKGCFIGKRYQPPVGSFPVCALR